MLAFGGKVADFTPAMEADDTFQLVMGLALVEPDLGAPLQIGVQNLVDMNRVRSTRPTSRKVMTA